MRNRVAGALLLFLAVSMTAMAAPANGTQVYWTGAGQSYNWSDPGNWNTNSTPEAKDDVIFTQASSKDAVIDESFGSEVNMLKVDGYLGKIFLRKKIRINHLSI